ncbi:LacI family DNA-binding transcriptional regulator [Martelella soudanensis]|uniref:LacI family DNA-binding transcriptional regulator n=1 Tax=unclassified Martelella TaxID=2629616 RepID=UPI0015DE3FA2|nr:MULTISPECIES: LacI family DNA-binding transcriptional regulator [unclassified Martelella]
MARPTLQSIANELGLSKFAVSRALSGKSGVSEGTRKLVEEAAKRQGYQPRDFRRVTTDQLVVIVRDAPTANRELWIDVRNGIEMQAMREGFNVRMAESEDADEVGELAETNLGVIILGPNRRSVMEAAHASGRPVVACCHNIPPLLEIDQVTGSDEESGAVVGEFLVSLGHRDIVYVHGQTGFPGREARLRGLLSAVGDSARISELALSKDYASSEFAPAMRRILDNGASPTAFFCGSDGVAITCQSEILRLGLRVPDDVTVIGHADYPLATQVSPMLTTIDMPHREIGLQAVHMIRNRISQSLGPAQHLSMRVHLVAELVERESSGRPGQPDWECSLSRAGGAAA